MVPTFFLAGAPKAGTTSLYNYLGQHPEIYLSPVKEPGFFASKELEAWESEKMRAAVERNRHALRDYVRGPMSEPLDRGLALEWDTYLQLFRHARGELALGEGSVVYFWAPSAPAAIRERVPDAKFVVVLRDPAERFVSHCLATVWAEPRWTVRERFEAAIARRDEWGPTLDAGCYATNLRRFFAHFPRENVRVHLYEDFRADPRAVLRDVFRFLGVRVDHPIDLRVRHNEPTLPRFRRLHRARRALLGNTSLTAMLPPGVRRSVQGWYRGSRRAIAPADRALLIEYFREEVLATADLIGRDLRAWLR